MAQIKNITSSLKNLVKDERGLTTVEYIIVLVLIAITGFAAWKSFGSQVKSTVNNSNQAMQSLDQTAGQWNSGSN